MQCEHVTSERECRHQSGDSDRESGLTVASVAPVTDPSDRGGSPVGSPLHHAVSRASTISSVIGSTPLRRDAHQPVVVDRLGDRGDPAAGDAVHLAQSRRQPQAVADADDVFDDRHGEVPALAHQLRVADGVAFVRGEHMRDAIRQLGLEAATVLAKHRYTVTTARINWRRSYPDHGVPVTRPCVLCDRIRTRSRFILCVVYLHGFVYIYQSVHVLCPC